MTFLRSKSIGQEILGHAERALGSFTGNHTQDAMGSVREYAGRAGSLTAQVLAGAGRRARRRPVGLAVGVGIGVGAIAATWLILRYRARVRPEEDEHNPTRQRPTDASGNALDGSGEDNPIAGDGVRY